MTLHLLFKKTSSRLFLIYPLALLLLEWIMRGDDLRLTPAGLALMVCGYLQFRLSGDYRTRLGGGGPGFRNPPERLVTNGIYAYTRNPMYLGMMIYLAGTALALSSWAGALLLLVHLPWFHHRALADEQQLRKIFGDAYDEYCERVKRWIPYLF